MYLLVAIVAVAIVAVAVVGQAVALGCCFTSELQTEAGWAGRPRVWHSKTCGRETQMHTSCQSERVRGNERERDIETHSQKER